MVYHHPAFNAGAEHYEEQQMRALSPLLEKHGVDFVLSGHEHNYQRTMPLRFAPGDFKKVRGSRIRGGSVDLLIGVSQFHFVVLLQNGNSDSRLSGVSRIPGN